MKIKINEVNMLEIFECEVCGMTEVKIKKRGKEAEEDVHIWKDAWEDEKGKDKTAEEKDEHMFFWHEEWADMEDLKIEKEEYLGRCTFKKHVLKGEKAREWLKQNW